MKNGMLKIEEIAWDPSIYPRANAWSTALIAEYADAIEAGAEFPAVVVEKETRRLLDGKHRLEAHKKCGRAEIPAREVTIPDGQSAKYFAATLSATHGLRLSNRDVKTLAEEDFERDPSLDPEAWGRRLGVSRATVYNHVSHILSRERASRETIAWRLSALGWTQREIAERLGVDTATVNRDLLQNSNLGKMQQTLGPSWNDQGIAEAAKRMELRLTDCYAGAMAGMSDEERFKRLGIKIQPYDVWNFQGCHDLMGDKHPGRTPGEIVCHVLWLYTQPGARILDPMAGSGTTLDACLLMGRKARGYDIDLRHDRPDIEEHDLSAGWPETAGKADLVYWDPPYFDKMDDGYVEGSVSGLAPDEYLAWFGKRFSELGKTAKRGARLAFLMSNWDAENAKRHEDHPGIFVWDYAGLLAEAGWIIEKCIECPLPTQQVHPDIVNKFRAARRLARLGRSLLIGKKP